MKSYTTDGKVRHLSQSLDINVKLAGILGEDFVRYRKVWDAANNFELETEFPLFLHFDLNQICNYRCPQCIIAAPNGIRDYYRGESLPKYLFEQAIDEASNYYCPSLSVQGNNEPLLIPDLEDYIIYAQKRGFIDIMFNTNGSLLTEDRINRLLDSGVTRIRFSLDAFTKETYERIRVGGNYERVVRNIENFLEAKSSGGYKLPVTGVSLVVQRDNFDEIDDFVDFWSQRVDMVTLQQFMPPVMNADYSRFYPPNNKYSTDFSDGFKCVQPFQRLVLRNREITPCCAMYSSELALGTFPEMSLYDAWNSVSMKKLREIHKAGRYADNAVCNKCVSDLCESSNRVSNS